MSIQQYLFDLEILVKRVPKTKTGELAKAMYIRSLTFFGNDPNDHLSKLRDLYLKAYLLAETPTYLPELWNRNLAELETLVQSLNPSRKIFVFSRLAETANALGYNHREYVNQAYEWLPKASWKGRSRLVISLSTLGHIEEALAISRQLKPHLRATTLAEASAMNPGVEILLREAIEATKKVENTVRRIVAISRLLKSYYMFDRYSSELFAEKISEKLSPVLTEVDAFLSLLVARNLAEASMHTASIKLYVSAKNYLQQNLTLNNDIEELLVQTALRAEGLDKALEMAYMSPRSWYLVPSLLSYAITSGYFNKTTLSIVKQHLEKKNPH